MTIKKIIVQHYEGIGDWAFAGKVAREIAYKEILKESNVERRMRELVKSGTLERRLVDVEGVANKVVQYRIAKVEVPIKGIVDSKTEQVVFKKADELIGQAMLFSDADVEF